MLPGVGHPALPLGQLATHAAPFFSARRGIPGRTSTALSLARSPRMDVSPLPVSGISNHVAVNHLMLLSSCSCLQDTTQRWLKRRVHLEL